MLEGLSPARKRFVLGALAVAVVVAVVIAVAVWGTRDPAVKPVSQATPGPVLLVPGYGGSTAALEVLAEALRKAGREATVVDAGRRRHRRSRRAGRRARQGGDPGDAAHGVAVGRRGGLLRRRGDRAAVGQGPRRRQRRPSRGDARLAAPRQRPGRAGRRPRSRQRARRPACSCSPTATCCTDLNAGDETPPGPLWVSIWSTDDQTVVPPSSADLDGALDFTIQSVCPDAVVAHGDLPRTPSVIAAVIQELGVGRPAGAGVGDLLRVRPADLSP